VLSEDEDVGSHGKDIVSLKYQVWPQPHVMIFVEDWGGSYRKRSAPDKERKWWKKVLRAECWVKEKQLAS